MKYRIIITTFLIIIASICYYLLKAQNVQYENIPDFTNFEINTPTMQIRSRAFEDGGVIPGKYTCDGLNINKYKIFSFNYG